MGQRSTALLVGPLLVATEALGEATSSSFSRAEFAPSFQEVANCQHSPKFRRFLDLVSLGGYRDRSVFNLAYEIYNNLDLPLTEEGDAVGMDWHTVLKVSPGMDKWMIRQVVLMSHVYGVKSPGGLSVTRFFESGGEKAELLPTDCPYGLLAVMFALLVGFQTLGLEEMRDQISNSLVAIIEVLFHMPYFTYDFLESSAWNFTVFDIAPNIASAFQYTNFGDFEARNPMPQPSLPPWHATGPDTAPLPRGDALQAAYQKLAQQTANQQKVFVAMVQFHDGTAAELWASVEAAVRSLAGIQSSWMPNLVDALQLQLYFTQVKALRGTETGEWLAKQTIVGFDRLQEVRRAALDGKVSLSDLCDSWLPREAGGLLEADLLICSEPFWLCPLLAARRDRAMVGTLHMSLLNEFPFLSEDQLSLFWAEFKAMMDSSKTFLSVSCRITGEQVRHQSGWRIPYVPFIGLGVQARYAPGDLRQALLFRNNRQNMLAFRAALKMFQAEAEWPMNVVDMNEVPRALSFQEIAEFHAVVLLPHGPNALRLSDLYAAAIPMVVPEEPLVHKFVWGSRTFGGYDAEEHYLSRAPEELRHPNSSTPPPFHPTNYLQTWSIEKCLNDRRYWYRYTEWATLPHLLHFSSLPSLLSTLAALTRQEGIRISTRMAKHHAVMVSDALSWWRIALADLISSPA